MTTHLHKLDDEAGRIKAFLQIDAETFASEATFDHMTRLLQLVLDIEMVTISLISADKQILKSRQGLDLKECSRETAFCNIAIRKYEPLVIEDMLEDARVRDNPFVTEAPFLRCYIGAPLTTAEGYNLGTICAFDSKPRRFTAQEIEIIGTFATLVMNHLELRSQANLDYLTGVYNRRSFASGLERELARLHRNNGHAVVAFLDLDHFKKVNDTFGHPVGDKVLQEFAKIVLEQCRRSDLVARLGGEEFAVLLTDTDIAAARSWAERMRKRVSETQFAGDNAVKLTVSVGLAAVDKTQTTSDVITGLADTALYKAKRLGRNCVVTP